MAKKRVSTSTASITAVVVACHATLDYMNEYCVTGKQRREQPRSQGLSPGGGGGGGVVQEKGGFEDGLEENKNCGLKVTTYCLT